MLTGITHFHLLSCKVCNNKKEKKGFTLPVADLMWNVFLFTQFSCWFLVLRRQCMPFCTKACDVSNQSGQMHWHALLALKCQFSMHENAANNSEMLQRPQCMHTVSARPYEVEEFVSFRINQQIIHYLMCKRSQRKNECIRISTVHDTLIMIKKNRKEF